MAISDATSGSGAKGLDTKELEAVKGLVLAALEPDVDTWEDECPGSE